MARISIYVTERELRYLDEQNSRSGTLRKALREHRARTDGGNK